MIKPPKGVCDVLRRGYRRYMVGSLYKETTFTVPWGLIAAKAWGPDDGKPFLGLHGWLDNANTFDRLAHLLPQDMCFIAIDFPGHGKSSHRWPGMPYTHFEYVADVKKVASQLGWEKFSIIGHSSMGANVASLYAGTFPHEVENLILLDFGGTAVRDTEKTAFVLAQYATRMSEAKIATPRVYQSLESAAARRQETFLGSTLRKEDAMLLTERGTRSTRNGLVFSHDPILKGVSQPFYVPHCSLLSVLSKIHCAVLSLGSTDTKDMLSSVEREARMERIKVIYQSAKFKVCKTVKGSHHFHLENSEQVAQEIKKFLALCRSQDCVVHTGYTCK